jgi:AcrR family transcriptional regulator
MKTSKSTQEQTRIRLITAGIDLMSQNGFTHTTMREISKKAKLSDATIYRYFPTKEDLVFGYFIWKHEEASAHLSTIKSWESYSLQEKLFTYFDTLLNSFLPHREFLKEALHITHRSAFGHYKDIQEIHQLFLDQVRSIIKSAIQKGEIPEQSVEKLTPRLIFDVYVLIALYWINDTSKGFSRTTHILDSVTGLIQGVLKENLIQKTLDLGTFLIKQHFSLALPVLMKGFFHDRR